MSRRFHIFIFLLLAISLPTAALASRTEMPIQGILRDVSSGDLINGSRRIVFRLYSTCDADTEEWADSQLIHVDDGYYNTSIDVPDDVITENDELCLGVQVGDDDEMSPRLEYFALPFARMADIAGTATTADVANTALSLDSAGMSSLAGSGLKVSGSTFVLDTASTQTWTARQTYSGQVVASGSPSTTSSSSASLRVNPTAAVSDGKLFAVQDNGTDRLTVDKEGDVVIAGDLTVTGSINLTTLGDITSVTASTGLTGGGTSGAVTLALDQSFSPTWTGGHTFNGATAFNTDSDFVFSGTENLTVTSDLAGSVNVFQISLTPSSTSGTTAGLGISQGNSANTNGLDAGIYFVNNDTDLAVTNGIQFASGGAGFTKFLDTPSLDISGSGAISGATGMDSSGTITFSGLASCTSVITDASGNLSCGSGAVSGGDVTAVTAGAGLTGGGTSGAINLDIGAGTGITVAADAISITADSIGGTQLAASLVFSDADLINLSAINASSTTEGLILPQAADVSTGTAEGQISWDTDNDTLYVGNGTSVTLVSNPFGAAVDSSDITDGTIVNADVNAAAAIAYSKLNLTGNIVNADVSGTAAIAYSKLNLSGAIVTGDVTDNTLTASDLNATLTLADSDFLDLSAINASSTTEGLKLPQASDVSAATAEGQISWDSDNDTLYVGTGASVTSVNNPFGAAIDSSEITDGTIVNADVSGTAAIAYSKLNLAGSITSADITNATIATADIAGSAVTTSEIAADTITASDINATLTLADSDFVDLSAINASSTTEGLKLPQATDVSAATAEGQISWDTDNDTLYVGNGTSATSVSNPFGSAIDSSEITDGTIVNADVSGTAAIAYSKLNLTGNIVNADIGAAAAIAYSKLNLSSSIVTGDVTDNTLTTSDLNATLTFADSDFLDLSSINASTATEGLKLPQATDVSAATAEGLISWDTDNDTLYVGNGTSATSVSNPFGSAIDSSEITDGTIVNADVSGTAAIAYSKLSLAGSITSSDITDATIATGDISTGGVATANILDDTVSATDLNATLTFADGDLLNLSAVNTSATTEGLILPQATDVSSSTAEGQITWDTNDDALYVGTGTAATKVSNPFGSAIDSSEITDGTIVNADINSSAAIAYGKLNLSNSILNADVNASAAIAYSKLNLANSVATGDILNGTIATADIAASAVTTTEIANNTITVSDLAANLDFVDGDFLDLSLINASGNTEGLRLPQGTDVSAISADGMMAWDTDNDTLYVGTGSSAMAVSNPFASSIDSSEITDGTIVNADVSATAAIAYSKLNLASSVVTGDITDGTIANADVSGTAAIAYSKLNLASSVVTGDITDNTLTASDLSATLTFADNDLIDLSAINAAGPAEGLILPQATNVTASTADGQISWDSDNDQLYVGNGSSAQLISNPFGLSIDSSEITDGTIVNADIADNTITAAKMQSNTLDFSEMKNGMTLDAALTISGSGSNYGINIDSNTLVVDTANNRVGIGTAAPSDPLHVVGNLRLIDSSNATNYFKVNEFLASANYPRAMFQGGMATSDANWFMRFSHAYSSSALNIPVGIQLTTNNDSNYTNSNTLMFYSTDTGAYVLTGTGAGSNGKALILGTSQSLVAGIYIDTVANSQRVGIGPDTSPDYLLEVNSAASSDATLALTDADVAHGLTAVAQTDVLAHAGPISSTAGGVQFTGISDTDAQALSVRGVMGSTNPTDTTPAVKIVGAKSDGTTGMADLAAAETVFQLANNDNTAAITVLGDDKVGIGDVTPAALLTVGSGDKFQVASTGNVTLADGVLMDLSAVNASATTEGLLLPQATDVSASTAEGQLTWDTDNDTLYVGTGAGQLTLTGDITAVGSMTSGATFADSTADDDWLGLGAAAGRIEFDDQATDEVNILSARVGIGTSTPDALIQAVSGNSTFRFVANGAGTNPVLSLVDTDTGGKAMALFADTTGSAFIFDGAGSFDITKDTFSNINTNTFGSGSSILRAVGSTKNVLIGTTTDAASRLRVDGTGTTYSAIFETGNVGVGDATPSALFTVGSGDKLQVDSSGNLTTAGTMASTKVNSAGGSVDVTTLSGTLGAMDGSDTVRGLYLNYTNADHSSTANKFYAIDVASITGDADATEKGLHVGTGFDEAGNFEGLLSLGSFLSGGSAGSLLFYDGDAASTSESVTINPPAGASLTGSYTLTLPVDDGTSGQVLITDGSGALSWTTDGGGDVTAVGDCASTACFTGTSGTILTSTTGEAINLATGDTFTFVGNTDGNSIVFTGSDGTGATNTTYDTTGAGAITIGSADVTAITLTTDSTGTAEVALPAGSIDSTETLDNTLTASDLNATLTFADSDFVDLSSINASSTTEGLKLPQATDVSASTAEGQIAWDTDNDYLYVGNGATMTLVSNPFGVAIDSSEITNNTVAAADVAADTLDYTEFQDTMDLDADLILNQTTYTWTQDYTGTTGTGLTFTNGSLTTGKALSFSATNTSTSATAIVNPINIALTNAQATNSHTSGGYEGMNLDYTHNTSAGITTGFESALKITLLQNDAAGGDTTMATLLKIVNKDTATGNSITVADGIKVEATTASLITDGIDVSDTEIDNSINVGANPIVTGNVAGTIGDSTTDSWTFTTDGTGDAEIALPTGSVSSTEILDDTIVNADINSAAAIVYSKLAFADNIVAGDIATSAVATAEILDNTITTTDLNATLTFADADFVDMSSINASGTGEGLKLPQATDVSASTAEGQITWDTDNNYLYVGDGAAATLVSNPFGAAIDSSEITDGTVAAADIAAAIAGAGLTGGAGSALAVGAGTGITVNADDVAVDQSFAPTWTGLHAFTKVNGAAASANVITESGTLGIMDGSDTFRGIYLNYTNANHTGAMNMVYGIDMASITGDADATELGLHVGTGYDYAASLEGAVQFGTFASGGSAGSLVIMDGDAGDFSESVTINPPSGASLTSSYTLTLPTTDGDSGQVLITDGSGALSWTTDGGGDITAVGSMTSGAAFADATADDDWLGLGSGAGRIEFDDQAADEVNILGASVGLGTATPGFTLDILQSSSTNIVSKIRRGTQGLDDTLAVAFGNPYLVIGGSEWTNLQNYETIGFGYTDATYTKPPAEIGWVLTDSTAGSKGDLVFGTRNVTTNTAPSERMRITASATVGIGDSSPDQLLEVMTPAPINTQVTISNTNAGDYDSQIGFELADGTNTFTMGVDDSDADKFKISTTALGTGDRLTIDSSGTVTIGALALGAGTITGAGLADCDSSVQKLGWDAGTSQFTCISNYPDAAYFRDSTSDTMADNSTTDLWDGTYPNITPTSASQSVLVSVSVQILGAGADNEYDSFHLYRAVGGTTAACTDTSVGAIFGNFTTDASGTVTASFTFIDEPATTSKVNYTICTDAATQASTTVDNTTPEINVTLVALGADLAENYYTKDESIDAGTLVSIDPALPAGVKKSGKAYDSRVLGIISTAPAHVMDDKIGDRFGHPVPVALSGRVPLKVTTHDGADPIEPGDFLTASEIPGVAMKATRPGTIVGKALTGLEQGEGLILVFVERGYQGGEEEAGAASQMILKSPGGKCFGVTVEDDGTLKSTPAACESQTPPLP